jgi:hypothetical protein
MTHQWIDNELLTTPQDVFIATTEKVPYSWDMSALLGEGETPSSPAVRVDQMTSKDRGVAIEDAVDGTPSVIGNIVVATIDGAVLDEGKLYRVVVTVNATPSKRISCMTMMKCVA